MFKYILLFAFFANVLQAATVDFSENAKQQEETIQSESKSAKAGTTTNRKLNLAENNPIAALLCKALAAFTGTIAKIIAVIMIIGLALVLFSATNMQPITPVTLVSVILGIGILFSADYVIARLLGDAGQGGGSLKKACDCKYGLEGACNEQI